ncbi:class I SAM-dependent methyltransferase [Streptomyces sp. H34-S4]|uniref:class I SAM-dependent methyltransferase n=1 Tax=Streptomyces sp. H34-S4 TaxID=2996463 RepID=UPI00226EA193|nr:class I SAM-dependent methyltransferase [Streptomyces sp. H34-S4]MCY0933935.1 class I SAM-dependent methyltransferase [Streptomyces sp. H34-S4]
MRAPHESPLETNRQTWDLLTSVHLDAPFYDTPAFLAGASSLKPVEVGLAGEVTGLRLLHLQCHFGLDSLSWARRGASVTGVDFSPAAIDAAKNLAAQCRITADFQVADVQQLKTPDEPFDLVVTTYGVLCWLADLGAWADGIRRSLRPGGRLIVVDFHPVLEALHPGKMTGSRSYFPAAEAVRTWTRGSYAIRDASISYAEFRWQHTVADVVTALLEQGLALERIEEYPYSSFPLFDELTDCRDGLWFSRQPATHPYMFSVAARRGAQ